MVKLILYTRAQCHLCAAAKVALRRLATEVAFEVEERDVDDDPAWGAAFGGNVPVGVVEDRKVFKYRVETDRLRTALMARGADSALRSR